MTRPTQLAARSAEITLADVFRRSARIFADRVALAAEDTRLTYRELDENANRLANALVGLGLRRGDRIAVLSEPHPGYATTYVAAAKVGITVVALNIRLHPDELRGCVDGASPRLLFTSGAYAETAIQVRGGTSVLDQVICFDGRRDGCDDVAELTAAGAAADPDTEVGAEDIHNILYTSGTTGPPKGAMISQRAAAARALRIAQYFELGPDDGFVGWLPLYHCGGDESLYATLMTGGKFYPVPRAEPERLFRAIADERLTWTLLLPGVITDFLHHPKREDYDLSSLRFAFGYANMMPQVVRELTKATGITYYDAFGQTETSYLVAYGKIPPGTEPSLRKTPTPLLDVRVVDDELREVPVGTPGECVVRGPGVMSGYLDDPQATEEVFRGGWLHTGDVLVRNEDGTLTFTDRKKYLIKTGGENVYPAEVEQVIAAHEAVQEVCVFGVPDERWGETVKAAVVLLPGRTATEAEIANWCRDHLAGYKRPRYVQFMRAEEMPRSATGKLLRHELAALPVTDEQRVEGARP
ncbi:MAG: AMP-binding protein [Streptosporangiales bacterium]|nr:AMP-binding protein [Streptosporangiales bacterium]